MTGKEHSTKNLLFFAGVLTFALVQAALLLVIKYQDISGKLRGQNILMYLSIVLDFLLALFLFVRRTDKKTVLFLFLALSFTFAADFFLTFLDAHYELGVALFCCVQTCYMLYLKPAKRTFFLRAGALLVFLAVLFFMKALDLLTFLSGYSIVNLLFNVLDAAQMMKKTPDLHARLLFLGLLLFLGCDLCVGLFNLSSYLPQVPSFLTETALFLIWCFYLPAQAVLPWCVCLKAHFPEAR